MSGYHQGTCLTPHCTNPQVVMNYNYNYSGLPGYRKWCRQCHETRTAARHGLKNIAQVCAKNAGFDNVADYKNSTHEYRQYRKTHCENIDGRLGHKCDCTIRISAQLQVDHIDGNPTNNDPENLQTLCANCHLYKTHANKDYLTPGRVAFGVTY